MLLFSGPVVEAVAPGGWVARVAFFFPAKGKNLRL